MKKIMNLLCLTITIWTASACKDEGGKSLLTPNSSGRPYEVLVVMDKAEWEAPAGRALFEALDTDVRGIAQSERSFKISRIDEKNYNRVYSLFRNIIIPDIQDIYTQPKFKFSRDVNASPQMIMTIQAPDEKSFQEYVAKNKQVIVDFFTKTEMNRQVKLLDKQYSQLITDLVKNKFNCIVKVPEDLQYYKRGENFLWASTNREKDDLNFVIYSYPFTDKETFTPEYFIHKRDSFMKANLPGPFEGSYMATDTLYIESNDIAVRGKYAQEVRGLWAMEGAVMGGPYVSHVRVDEENGRVIVVEGFVYSPNRKKGNLIRKMEASLYTLEFPEDIKTDEQTLFIDSVSTNQ